MASHIMLRDSKKEENESESLAAQANTKNEGKYGKIVKIHGGHIVRSTKKDKHTKVLTSKGPRDRRFRLSAKTAIDFYDVQDRLRCDRPSMAIDWLIDKAKAVIDALDDQPHLGSLVEPEAAVTHQHCDKNAMKNVSKELDHDFAEEAVNCAPEDFMDMEFFQSLIVSNSSSFSPYVTWK